MDRVTLTQKDRQFMARFAAVSVLTGFFVACIEDSDRQEVETAFTDPGEILVHNMEELYADKTYTGYVHINEIRESGKEITVILDKGDQ